MRDCTACRWFGKYDAIVEEGETFVLGDCGRPEGPLDARTVRPMILSHPSIDGHITASAGMPVLAGCGKVSSGMGCRAFEARYFETDVTQVTAKDRAVPDLFGE